jgi:hypothetical protein
MYQLQSVCGVERYEGLLRIMNWNNFLVRSQESYGKQLRDSLMPCPKFGPVEVRRVTAIRILSCLNPGMLRWVLMPNSYCWLLRYPFYVTKTLEKPKKITKDCRITASRKHTFGFRLSRTLRAPTFLSLTDASRADFLIISLLRWRWRRYVPPKRRLTPYLHGATSQKTAFFITRPCLLFSLHRLCTTPSIYWIHTARSPVSLFSAVCTPDDDQLGEACSVK